jgi:polyhydroxyalkanoate synthesis repressor PhaR
MTTLIKRYTNRKLYDTTQHAYVTLEDIAEYVINGVDIQVIDNKTKNDITSVTLLQALVEREKRLVRPSDTELLKRILSSREGNLLGYIKSLEVRESFSKGETVVDLY